MKKKSQHPVDRTKRNPRDPSPERERDAGLDRDKSWRPTDENEESDGTVDSEQEFDTEKYERATPKDR